MLGNSFDTVAKMSLKENIQFFHQFDPDAYLTILLGEYAAREHPSQPDAFLIDELPFYKPEQIEDHVSILSFNYAPLSSILINALVNHPELVPNDVLICWTIEQELLLETTMGEVRSKGLPSSNPKEDKTPERPHQRRPYETFGFTDEEATRFRVTDERLKEILARPNTTPQNLKLSTNTFGEFLFLTTSRGVGPKRIYMTFYGFGYHKYRERWISDEWFWYQANESAVDFSTPISGEEVIEQLEERLSEISHLFEKDTQTERGRKFEHLADLFDDDAALDSSLLI
jgi:hypothetical protein